MEDSHVTLDPPHTELHLELDLNGKTIECLKNVFKEVINIIYNEIEYLKICERLNEIFISYEYQRSELKEILKLSKILYHKLEDIYNYNLKKIINNEEKGRNIIELNNNIYNGLYYLKKNCEEAIRMYNEPLMNITDKIDAPPKIMKKVKRRE